MPKSYTMNLAKTKISSIREQLKNQIRPAHIQTTKGTRFDLVESTPGGLKCYNFPQLHVYKGNHMADS